MKRRAAHVPRGEVRIIGGAWRSRRLSFPASESLRPTPDRVRETVFNWLTPYLPGAACLDLFAGSGAFGFEALSRAAARAVLVEKRLEVVAALRHNRERPAGPLYTAARSARLAQAGRLHLSGSAARRGAIPARYLATGTQ
jgi:16S rRNA (guanine966-N2)-methyltransferase